MMALVAGPRGFCGASLARCQRRQCEKHMLRCLHVVVLSFRYFVFQCLNCMLSAATVREAHVTLLGCLVFPFFCFPEQVRAL